MNPAVDRSPQRQFELALPRLQRLQAQLGIDHRAWYRRVLGGNIVAGEAEIAANELAAKEIEFVTELFRSLPGASDYSDFNEVLTGVDLVTGEELSNFQYTVTVVGAVIPFAGSAPQPYTRTVVDAGFSMAGFVSFHQTEEPPCRVRKLSSFGDDDCSGSIPPA